MLGVWANFGAVVVGGLLGTLLRGGIKEKYSKTINVGLALCVLLIGMSGALQTQNMLLVIISIVIGCFLGELMRIEDGLDALGDWAQRRFAKNDTGFANGFVNATLLFCVGAMAVVGSLEAGLQNNPETLIAKAALDGVSAIIFASSFGIGVIFSAIPLTIYQGGIALLAGVLAPFLTDALIQEMSAVGSILIIGLSINMLGLTKERIRVGNMLPAILVPCVYIPVANWLSSLI
ncbi:MAG: DUF554 domain-containing protein [Clostridia bacterium]|nr:DUF554 domain-containing protein [Clostridia bacterium]